jgi:hypothetical protein
VTDADASAPTYGPWQGGLALPPLPPAPPNLEAGAIVVTQATDNGVGTQISYADSTFFRSARTVGSQAVPTLIALLPASEVKKARDEIVEQLATPGSGLDEAPLRAFVEAANVYLAARSSARFEHAVFGSITEQTSPSIFLDGAVSFPNGVVGTVQYEAGRIIAETHLPALPAAKLTPLRPGDVRSLIDAVERAMSYQQAIDPIWGRLLTLARQELDPS